MEYRSSEIKAGLFIFISLIALIIMIFTLGNIQDRFKPKKTLKIVFNFIGGLEVGASVRYAGLEVGRVRNIELLDSNGTRGKDRVAVITEIDPTIHLKDNSTATIKTRGLMGGLYIDIRPGTASAPYLDEEQDLVGQDQFEFAEIGDMMEEVVVSIKQFIGLADGLIADSRKTINIAGESLENVNQVVIENRGSFRASLNNLVKVSERMATVLDENHESIHHAIHHVASAAEKTDQLLTSKSASLETIIDQTLRLTREMELLVGDTRPGITSLVRSLETDAHQITTHIGTTTARLDTTLEQSNAMLAENRRNLLELTSNLKDTSRNLKALSADLKRNPWKLVRKTDEPPPEPGKAAPERQPGDLRMKRLNKVSD